MASKDGYFWLRADICQDHANILQIIDRQSIPEYFAYLRLFIRKLVAGDKQ